MKIKKKLNIKASQVCEMGGQPIPLTDGCKNDPCCSAEPSCKYQCAIDFISNAIESLAEIAKDDPIAKDSIANLGVVLFDLKGNCE